MFNFRTTRLGRFINQNLIAIGLAILGFIVIIIVLQILNEGAKENKVIAEVTNKVTDTTAQTVVSGSNVSEEKSKANQTAIDTFIQYCNTGKIEEAYNLISQDCKNELYPTIEYFRELYWSPVFKTSKSYSIQSWITESGKYTYKVKLLEDMLATGKYDNTKIMEDYFTIINSDDGDKISVNSFVEKKLINKSNEVNGKIVTIVSKQVYMDYEVYTIKVENNSNKTILLDSQESFNYAYLVGQNEVEYDSYMDEVFFEDLKVEPGQTKNVNIKFNKMYNPSTKIKAIVFSDIISDYDTYISLSNKEEYLQREKVQIDL